MTFWNTGKTHCSAAWRDELNKPAASWSPLCMCVSSSQCGYDYCLPADWPTQYDHSCFLMSIPHVL